VGKVFLLIAVLQGRGGANGWWNVEIFPLQSRDTPMVDCLLLRNGGGGVATAYRTPARSLWITWLSHPTKFKDISSNITARELLRQLGSSY
jgi:hypothetical protein